MCSSSPLKYKIMVQTVQMGNWGPNYLVAHSCPIFQFLNF